MDDEKIKQHWELIKLGALHDYVPDQSHAAIQDIVKAYGQKVDTNCGVCIIDMMKRIYNVNKDKFGT